MRCSKGGTRASSPRSGADSSAAGQSFCSSYGGPGRATADHSDFFEALFGRANAAHAAGEDHHAKVQIDLLDAYRGGRRTVSLQVPTRDAQGNLSLQLRQLDVQVPKGIREGQHLRLKGQGRPGAGGARL